MTMFLPAPEKDGLLLGRKLEFFHHASRPEWGYAKPQNDTFAVLHPETEPAPGEKVPLYAVFHSAGHDVYSCIGCTWADGNHDIYHTPKNMYGVYFDCRAHSKDDGSTDWWWGGLNAWDEANLPCAAGADLQPVEKRILAELEWVLQNYPVDRDRVYAGGNSMGGSGALGIALRHGDVFAAIKVNVPAGVRHASDRCFLSSPAPADFTMPDPPVVVDYSAQNDTWSHGHEILYRGMAAKKYLLYGYWGAFGHENNNTLMEKENDLIHSFDLFSVARNAPYPVFTNGSTDDPIPWPDHTDSKEPGQVNAFFRWENRTDSPSLLEMDLYLLKNWKTRFTLPEEASADVSFRRLQQFKVRPGETLRWTFGAGSGTVTADAQGLVTIPALLIRQKRETLKLER